jgi:Na+/phosphate symporter
MVIAIVPFVVAVVGALMYGFTTNAKLTEVGRLLFFIGSFWAVYETATKQIHF